MSPAVLLVGFSFAAIFILSLLYSPFLVSVFLTYLAGVFMFDYEKPQRAILFGVGTLLVLIFLLLQNETLAVAIPAMLLFLVYLFIQFKKKFQNIKFCTTCINISIIFLIWLKLCF